VTTKRSADALAAIVPGKESFHSFSVMFVLSIVSVFCKIIMPALNLSFFGLKI
jgi:hypothetical protein